jgi:hypothetical protein
MQGHALVHGSARLRSNNKHDEHALVQGHALVQCLVVAMLGALCGGKHEDHALRPPPSSPRLSNDWLAGWLAGVQCTMLVGSVASVTCPVWYASKVESPSPLQVIAYASLTGFVVCFSPIVWFAAWGVATAERRSCKRAAQGIVFGVILSAIAVTIGFITALYVTLSDQVSGSAGVVINGKGSWRDN